MVVVVVVVVYTLFRQGPRFLGFAKVFRGGYARLVQLGLHSVLGSCPWVIFVFVGMTLDKGSFC